jgi:hypothetical protein
MKFHTNTVWWSPSLKPAYIDELIFSSYVLNFEDEGRMFLRNVSIDLQYHTAQKATMWTVTTVEVSNLLFHIENLKHFWLGVSAWSRKIICYFIKFVDLCLSVISLALRMWVSLGICVCSKWISSHLGVKYFKQNVWKMCILSWGHLYT